MPGFEAPPPFPVPPPDPPCEPVVGVCDGACVPPPVEGVEGAPVPPVPPVPPLVPELDPDEPLPLWLELLCFFGAGAGVDEAAGGACGWIVCVVELEPPPLPLAAITMTITRNSATSPRATSLRRR